MTTDMYERFIALIESLQSTAADASTASAAVPSEGINSSCTFQLSDFTFARTGASGYYVMSLVSHPEIQIDICEYMTVTDASGARVLRHNMDPETVEGFHYPDYTYETIFPLRKVSMLGVEALVPQDSDAVTAAHFGSKYQQVLWTPYVLTLMYNPFLTRTLWQSPVREIPILDCYLDGFARYGANSPFLVRRPAAFAHVTRAALLAYTRASEAKVFGYDARGEVDDALSVRELVEAWEADTLHTKVLDSPLECTQMPADFVALDVAPQMDEEERLAQALADEAAEEKAAADGTPVPTPAAPSAGLGLLLTRSNAYTYLHLDPPYLGGGWMYLASGVKSWSYLSPEYIDLLYNPATNRLRDLPPSELVTRFGYQLHGKLLQVTARAGDLVYFPPAWMHRVVTYEKCIGVSGYMRPIAAHANMRKYTDALAKKGVSSIWNGNPNI
jgi:hypothetical protein